MEYVLPSSVVLTGFEAPTMVPIVGMVKDMAPEQKERLEPKQYPDDFNTAVLPAELGIGERGYDARIRVTVPEGYRVNATGSLVSETSQAASARSRTRRTIRSRSST